MHLKEPANIEKQMELLILHGIYFSESDKSKVFSILKEVNYYRLTGYALEFRIEPNSSNCVQGTTFKKIYLLYQFDKKLRNLLLYYLDYIEAFYRTQISYHVAEEYCYPPPHDQHYDINNYYKPVEATDIFKNVTKEIKRNKDSLIVSHHKNCYGGKMPIWVLVQLMSFSTLSKYYSCLYKSVQAKISHEKHNTPIFLVNHLHCMSILRNKCTHGARIYNTKMHLPIKLGKKFLRENKNIRNDSLFSYMIIILNHLSTVEKNYFLDDLIILLENYRNIIDIKLMGFPDNWKECLAKHQKTYPLRL